MSLSCHIERFGGPEVLQWADTDIGMPAAGQIRLRHTAVGVNYIDTYHRTGLYPQDLPAGLGMEAAGVVTAVGDGVAGLRSGDRVAYALGPPGAYAEERLLFADRAVKLPETVDDRSAAALMLKGMTCHFLLFRTFPLKPTHTVLIHAAAGGVGSLLCAWAAHIGARVIGTAGSAAKVDMALANGCDTVIPYRDEPVAERVRELTDGRGVDVVYDGVGAATFTASLDSLAPMGMLVSFGNASGPVPAFAPSELASRGSLFFTRPTLLDYARERADLEAGAQALFAAIGDGVLQPNIGQTYALTDAAQAHRDLEARRTVGASLLLPKPA